MGGGYGTVVLPIGMACACVVLVSIIVLGFIDRRLINRLSIRLIFALALADLLNHIGGYLSITQAQDMWTSTCYGLAGFQMFTRTFYNFTNLAICFNLFRSLILMKKSTWAYELAIWIGMFIFIVPLMVGYYFLGAFTGTFQKAGCNPGSKDKTNDKVFSFLAGFICLITILSGILVTYFGHKNMNRYAQAYVDNGDYKEEDKEALKKQLRKMAQLSFLYPLATCITLPAEMIYNFMKLAGYRNTNAIIAMTVLGGLSGLFTFIAFILDPAVWRSAEVAYKRIRYRNSGKSSIFKFITYTNLK
jgi:hypothetical protein